MLNQVATLIYQYVLKGLWIMLEKLMNSPIAWGILSLLAVFSTVFAIYTWLDGKKHKRFSVSCKTNEIIIAGKNQIDKLNIQYDGYDIPDLSSSKFYIWNSGNTVIYPTDIVVSRPLCIKNCGNSKILDAQIIRNSEETNNFSITKNGDDFVELSFDYVDHGEGVVMQILHTGPLNELELDCKIIGGKEIFDRSPIKRKKEEPKSQVAIDIFCAMLPAVLSFGLFFLSLNLVEVVQKALETVPWIGVPVSVLIMVLAFATGIFVGIIIPKLINKRLHRTIPSSLLK